MSWLKKKIRRLWLREANRKGSWLVIHSEDLDRIIDERRIAKSSRDT